MKKQYTVQAKNNEGVVIYDQTLSGVSNKFKTLREVLDIVAITGGKMRQQTVGAKTWAYYTIEKNATQAVQVRGMEW